MRYTPRVGDRVRVVLEGEVGVVELRWFTIGVSARANAIFPDAPHVVSVERLPDPEPEWQPGDVVLAADGAVYRRDRAGMWSGLGAGWSVHEIPDTSRAAYAPVRPLTLLVRDGKPATS